MPSLRLDAWSAADHDLLRRINTPEMKAHLGGPETSQAVADRHTRYLGMTDPLAGRMFRVVLLPSAESVGTIGYWAREWGGTSVYETGWSVLPEFQGRRIAAAAALLVARSAASSGDRRWLHAYPKLEHGASNAVCRRAGFELMGPCDFEYPPGHPIRCNDWRLDLHAMEAS